MIGFITACALILIGVLAARFLEVKDINRKATRVPGIILGCFLAALGLCLMLFKSTFFISSTEIGVPITFGKLGAPVESGVHVKAPWTSVVTLPIRPYALPEDIKIVAQTSQGNVVTTVYGGRWEVDAKNAGATYLQVRSGDEGKISKELVEKSLGAAILNVYVKYDNQTATRARVEAEGAVFTEANRILAPYGVRMTQVFLRSVTPDEKTRQALEKVSAAKSETEIAEQKVLTAKQEALAAAEAAKGAKAAAGEIPSNLTATQVQIYCAQLWANAVEAATEKGVPLWTTPCAAGSSATPLVQAKG